MAEIKTKMRFVLRNDIASYWTSANPVLLKAEMGLETDTLKFKFGDGSTNWNDLPYAGVGTDELNSAIESYINTNILEDGKIKTGLLPDGTGAAAVYSVERTLSGTDEAAIKAKVTELKTSTTFKQGDIFIVTVKETETMYEMTGYIIASKPATNDEAGVWTAVKALNGYVDADKVILKQDITMAGDYTQVGNLTKQQTGTAKFATKGKSVADAFVEIFSKEIYPTTSNSNGNWSLSIGKPSISGASNNAVMKVNSTITFAEVTAPAQSSNTNNKPTVSGFTYGYKDSTGGELQSGKSISVEWSVSTQPNAKYVLNASKSGFSTTELTSTTAENEVNTACKLGQNVLKLDLGANSYTVTVTGPGMSGSAESIPAKYIVSNLGNTDEGHKSTELASQSGTKGGATGTTTINITGVYPVYHNSKSKVNQLTADQEIVQNISSLEVEFGPANVNRNQFSYPKSIGNSGDSGHCTVELWNKLAQAYETYNGSVEWSEAEKDVNGTSYTYVTWKDSAEYTENSKYKFTFTKSTSSK